MSTPDPASRWAMPVRTWHRPTWGGVTSAVLFAVVWAGAVLVLTGDTGGLVVGCGSMLAGLVMNHYHAEEESPLLKRFTHAPDEDTRRRVHETVAEGRLPEDEPLRSLALDYAGGWAQQIRRILLVAGPVVLVWCVVAVALQAWFNTMWPESATTRTWGLRITVLGSVGWLLFAAVPAAKRLVGLLRLRNSVALNDSSRPD